MVNDDCPNHNGWPSGSLGCMVLFVLLLRLDLDRHSNLRITHNTAYYEW
jgi:hypothetical protein